MKRVKLNQLLACSLNATEIFWSDWLEFIQHYELFTDGSTVNSVLVSLSVTHTHTQQISSFSFPPAVFAEAY